MYKNPFDRHFNFLRTYKQYSDFNKSTMKFAGAFKPIQEIMKPLQQLSEPLSKISELMIKSYSLQRQLNTPFNNVGKRSRHLKSKYQRFNNPLFEFNLKLKALQVRINEINEKTPSALLLLAGYGWYLDYDSELTLPLELANLVENEEIEKLDKFLIEYYENKLESVINQLCEKHPKRAKIFKQIEVAHRDENYFVSIPCILSQVDGISHDFAKKKFFIKDRANKYLPEITSEVTNITNLTLEAFLSPLTNKTPIMVRESELGNYPIALNRHKILHGVDAEYGSKINSLKCISLLKYLSDILTNIEENN